MTTTIARPGVAHVLVAVALVCSQPVVMFPIALSVFYQALIAAHEACLSSDCDGLPWMDPAMWTQVGGSAAVFVVTAVVVGWRLVKRRPALGVAITGCVLQIFVIFVAVLMLSLSG